MQRFRRQFLARSARRHHSSRAALQAAAIVGLVSTGLAGHAFADATWTGAVSSDPNAVANWDVDPNGQTIVINNTANPGSYPVLTANSTFTPIDLRVGTGVTGRLDQTGGTFGTGDGNWFFLGYLGATASFNLANTAATGGTTTGFGTGSGSFNVGGATQGGILYVGLDTGTTSTLNVNTTGTLSAGTIFVGGAQGAVGTMNLDNGTVNLLNEFMVGGSPFTNPATNTNNTFNMSGGTLTADIVAFGRGINDQSTSTGFGNFTGGTINSKRWFTLGFAGTSTSAGTVTNNGGTINVNTAGGGVMEIGVFDAASAQFTQNSGATNLLNNATIGFGNGGNHTGAATFTQNGGSVTFYGDTGTTVGGTGGVVLGVGGSTGVYAYNFNGGTLTTPSITKTAAGATGTFNFNGGTLKPTASSNTFVTGLTSANVQAGGAKIDTNGFDVTIDQPLLADLASTGGGLTKSGAGKLTLTGANTYAGRTVVQAGTLQVAYSAIAPSAADPILTGGGVNIQSGRLVIDYTGQASPIANVRSLLTASKAGNFATGQFQSSTATTARGLGYGDNGAGQITVRATLYGDADLDGDVDFNDFLSLQSSFGNTGTRFDQGNFDYNNVTDFNDFLALQANFGQSVGGDSVFVTADQFAAVMSITSANQVPEPASLAIAALGGLLLGRRRRGR